MPGADTALAQGLDVQALLCDDRRVRPAEVHPNPFNSGPKIELGAAVTPDPLAPGGGSDFYNREGVQLATS